MNQLKSRKYNPSDKHCFYSYIINVRKESISKQDKSNSFTDSCQGIQGHSSSQCFLLQSSSWCQYQRRKRSIRWNSGKEESSSFTRFCWWWRQPSNGKESRDSISPETFSRGELLSSKGREESCLIFFLFFCFECSTSFSSSWLYPFFFIPKVHSVSASLTPTKECSLFSVEKDCSRSCRHSLKSVTCVSWCLPPKKSWDARQESEVVRRQEISEMLSLASDSICCLPLLLTSFPLKWLLRWYKICSLCFTCFCFLLFVFVFLLYFPLLFSRLQRIK